MRYLFLYFIVPAVLCFLVQSILCRKVDRGILRHGALIFVMIPMGVGGVRLFTGHNDMFGGLGVMGAVLWMAGACSAAFGYGAAWLLFLVSKRRKNRSRKE